MFDQTFFSFFRDLKENNHKEWFDKNKNRYEIMKKSYHDLTGAILSELKLLDPTLAGLEVKQCVFRINKDIRFSKDKSPYKTAMGMIFTPYGRKMQLAGYYLHLEDGASFVGGGLYMPPNDAVKKIRTEIINFKDEFMKIVTSTPFSTVYGDLHKSKEIMLVNVPKEVAQDDPIAEYVRLKSFTSGKQISNEALDKEGFAKKCAQDMMAMHDFIHFLNRGLMSDQHGGI